MIAYEALAAAEPHPKPIYQVVVDGKDISSSMDGRLIELTHVDNRGFEADTLDIRLDDADGKLDLPPRGAEIRFSLGWAHEGLVDKGSYTVDEVEHSGTPDVLCIRARSADLRGGLTTQRERSWHATTLGSIVRTIADECELQPVIPPVLADIAVDHIDQTNESSINLLTRLAQRHDAVATVKLGRLMFIPAAGGTSASGKPLPAITITRSDGDLHRFSLADRNTYTAVRALYYDVQKGVKGEVIWGKDEDTVERKLPPAPAAAPTGDYKQLTQVRKSRAAALKAARQEWQRIKKDKAARGRYVGVKASYNDTNVGTAGTVHYGQAEEEKKAASARRLAAKDAGETPARNAFDHSADNLKTLRHVYASKANAERAARAEWRQLQRGMATFGLTLCRGRADLFPEIPVALSGWKPQIDSTAWIITKVTNTLGEGGFTTAVEMEIRATEIPD